MDRRLLNKNGSQNEQKISQQLSNQQLNDSLIFNIMKKIQTRQQMIEEYKKQKEQTNKHLLTKYYIHGQVPMYYACGMILTKLIKIIYMKQGAPVNSVLSVPNTLFHVCVFLSLNEYYKYRNIFYLRHELGEEYKIYQRNVETLMEQKINQFSLAKKLSDNKIFDQEHLIQTFKYRLVL